MINSVGYTEDGKVFFTMNAMVDGKPAQLTVTVTPEEAKSISDCLITAVDKATGYRREINERNRKHDH